ncbi:MAG: hypothetical protein ACUVXA_19200 [Candidatus Jordarchaeum sp.]|uniref:hypothetical protein n=1 Tax=Candidatus Jordarchaeum sp. TaxID=2823881 RepID=UPI004049EB6E
MSMIDANIAVFFLKQSFEDVGKVFGPSYLKLLIEYAREFEAEKLGESPPNGIETLNDIVNYILGNLDRYPRGYCALVYGNAKADSKIEGSTGAAWKRSGINALKQLMQPSGLLNSSRSPIEALESAQEFAQSINMAAKLQFMENSDDTVSIIIEECPFTDSCEAFEKEGISRISGKRECANLICYTAAAQLMTGRQCDYSIRRTEKYCNGKIFHI